MVAAKRALVRLSSSPTAPQHESVHAHPTINQFLIALELSAIRVDRRPSSYPIPFHDVYLIELQQHMEGGDSAQSQGREQSWTLEVEAGLQRVKDIGGEAALLGVW
jgi:hypothetical protein